MILELKNINFNKGRKKILTDINLKIDLGKFIAITGPNGSGKSSLMKIVMGIIKPTSGQLFFNGKDITKLDIDERAKLGISFAFQQPVKFKGITVLEILKTASIEKLTYDEAKKILKRVGLEPDEYINRELDDTLSGGELKRIEIASVILRKSKLTIFDEPEAGIDLWSFNNLLKLFKLLKDEISGTTVIISHQEKILKFADEIVLIHGGKIIKVGNYEEIVKVEQMEEVL